MPRVRPGMQLSAPAQTSGAELGQDVRAASSATVSLLSRRAHSQCAHDSSAEETSRGRILNSKPDSIKPKTAVPFSRGTQGCFKNTQFLIEMR